MKLVKSLIPLICLVLLFVVPEKVLSQQRRQPARPVNKTTPTTAPVTFDTLLGSGRYKVYAEVRSVGQLIRSDSVSELLEPVLKLAGPPKELRAFIKWISAHSEEVMTSRMLLATWPGAPNVPDVVIAIEFESAEEASKFLPQLNSFLPRLLPPQPAPSASPNDQKSATKSDDAESSKPAFFLKQSGALIVISTNPINLKYLHPSGNKLLTDQPSFRVARNRFTSEHVFLYIDVNSIEKEDEDRRKQNEEEERKFAEARANAPVETQPSPSPQEAQSDPKQPEERIDPPLEVQLSERSAAPAPTPDPLSTSVGMIFNSFFMGEGKWPDAIGLGISFEHDSFDVRALLVSAPGERCDVLPFVPNLKLGSPIAPESPSILPADTELFATLSLDLPQIVAAVNKPFGFENSGPQRLAVADETSVLPIARLEGILKINIKEELLPLLGPEVVVSMPVSFLEDGPRRIAVPADDSNATQPTQAEPKPPSGPPIVVALSLRDREGMQTLLPKIVDSLGVKGASSFAQKERREDTEIVSYADMFSYAFVGNFLVLSLDKGALRHVVDSYLKHETLSSDAQFKNFTRWQPRQLQAQVYISPALMESYKRWAEEPSSLLSDQTREFLLRLTAVPQPIAYSLSNDGLGVLHEVHVPKDLILTAVAAMSAESNPSPLISNERNAMSALRMIANVEAQYRTGEGQGSFASLEKLIENQMISKDSVENNGYKIEIILSGNKFEVTATPLEYGKTGRTSYYIDNSNILRGADHGGGPASAADKPL
jgi:hypothetical protein